MEKSVPTRQHLIVLRKRYDVVRKGLVLLKSKREALMREFFGAVEENIRMRTRLAELFGRGQRRVEVARALNGAGPLESFAHSAKRDVTLNIRLKNIWGVNVPEIEEEALIRTLEARDTSPMGQRAEFFDVARDFEAIADQLVKIASREIKLHRIGEMIRADTRKINAITEVMLPVMKKDIKSIERVLDEREMEEVFRLKRHKRMRE